MKILKAKVLITHNDGGTQYTYPQEWLDNKERIPSILYPEDRTDDFVENGLEYRFVYPIVPDDLADTLLQFPEFSTTTEAEVKAYSDKHIPKREVVRDQATVLSILAKLGRGEALTQTEQDALNPNSPEPGVTMSRDFIEISTDYGVVFEK